MHSRRVDGAVLATMGLLSALVCWPMVGGPLLLLDWVVGRRTPVLPRTVFGLDGGQLAAAPLVIGVNALSHLIGDVATWLPFVLFFPIAGLGAARLAGGEIPGRVAAALLFTCNPFVFDRIAVGQVGVLVGMAVLPWGARAALDRTAPTLPGAARIALLWSVMLGAGVHFAWIYGVVVALALAVIHRARLLALAALLAALINMYLVVGPAGQQANVIVTRGDLLSYRSQHDAHLGLWPNLAGLYGFWRRATQLPKDVNPLWPLVLLLILAVVLVGARAGWRDPMRRDRTVVLGAAGLVGLLLAAGDQDPFGSIFRWMFDHVGAFQIMREPQKFLVLLVLAYSLFFAWGVDVIFGRAERGWLVAGAAALALPLLYTPTIANGLHGQVKASHEPTSYAMAARAIKGEGGVLVLPWHLYLSFPYTHRVILNPGSREFGAVISGDNVELPGMRSASTSTRSAYIEAALARGSANKEFGAVVAPLGIRRVVLLKTVDFASYSWLATQSDLAVEVDTPEVMVLSNSSPLVGRDSGVSTQGNVTPQEAALHTEPSAGRVPLVGEAVPVSKGVASARRVSTTKFVVDGPPGALALLPEPWSKAWRAEHGGKIVETAWGTMAVRLGEHDGRDTISVPRARVMRTVFVIELAGVFGLALGLALARRRGPQAGAQPGRL